MKNYIKDKIITFFNENKLPEEFNDQIEILVSKDSNYGDYNSNIALKLSKKFNKKPMELAKELKEFLLDKNFGFSKITISEPGFINFFLSNETISNKLILFKEKDYQPKLDLNFKKLNYEFVSANPTGFLHIGHARNAIVGDSFLRIMQYLGYDITREFYINDAGNQITNLGDSVYYYYQKFLNKASDLDPEMVSYHGQEIIDFAKNLSMHKRLYRKEDFAPLSKKHFLAEIKNTLSNLDIKPFDIFTSEQWIIETKKVEKMFKALESNSYVYKKDNALWMKTEIFGDDKDRVLIKSDGSYTYMVPDVAYHAYKYDRNYEWMINLWGSDHHGYEKRVKAGLEVLGYDSKKLDVDYISMVKILENGKELKMSKRKGTSVTINDLLTILDKDILKFYILSKKREQQLKIDLESIKEKNINNPYWYVQYVNARLNKLFIKFNLKGENLLVNDFKELLNLEAKKEKDLVLKLLEFDDILKTVSLERDANSALNYLKDLASKFHSYYGETLIIDKNHKNISEARISLLLVFQTIYQKLFELLGISVINEM